MFRTLTRPGPASSASPYLIGVLFCAAGTALYSVNDMAIKHLSGGYALHQVILIRALIGLSVLLPLIARSRAGFAQLRTRRPLRHLIRVVTILLSNSAFYLGLAALPMADAAAVSYTSPLFVTALSVLALGERAGPRRWLAVALGLLGTLLILRPGSGVLQGAALLVLLSSVLYASSNLMARSMRETESAMTCSFYSIIGFVVLSLVMGFSFGGGHMASAEGVWQFLFRPWVWPPMQDWPWFLLTGTSVTLGGLMVTQAYRTTEAGMVAPFEYVGMPMAILWGVIIFDTLPDLTSFAGIALICGAGIYVIWREAVLARRAKT
ncbi:DMT family transporter [Pseudogemmobacter faecipullorum]|uniref:DMT family transporter n=1 Tax=Pseudogemmobacter faecipullorum TaxID=2755041 RepID=A0ABS8CID3_9RHOB|nr:DMT family transporter [Pseudogemmobacter faecipullorum]MCB5408900.1 DMT family transporter [Pseudogemmobacter faecipullorum]